MKIRPYLGILLFVIFLFLINRPNPYIDIYYIENEYVIEDEKIFEDELYKEIFRPSFKLKSPNNKNIMKHKEVKIEDKGNSLDIEFKYMRFEGLSLNIEKAASSSLEVNYYKEVSISFLYKGILEKANIKIMSKKRSSKFLMDIAFSNNLKSKNKIIVLKRATN